MTEQPPIVKQAPEVCPVCGAKGVEPCSTRNGRDHKARWAGTIKQRRAEARS